MNRLDQARFHRMFVTLVFLQLLSVIKVLQLIVGPCLFYVIELMCWKLAVGQCGFWKMPTGGAAGDGGDRFFVHLQSWQERRREKTQSPPTICILILFSCRRAPKPYTCKTHSNSSLFFSGFATCIGCNDVNSLNLSYFITESAVLEEQA